MRMFEGPALTGRGQPIAMADLCDPWRHRMRRTAERLRKLDAQRFEAQIEKIESCLERDAHWDLSAALDCWNRGRATE